MTKKKTKSSFGLMAFLLVLVIFSSCSAEPAVGINPSTTPTPTKVMQVVPPAQTDIPSKCAGLSGELEAQVLVGPAEVVGLEPHSVGSIPFAVTTNEAPFLLQGGGDLVYGDMLAEEWGTYEVTLNLQVTLTGECYASASSEELAMKVEMAGFQNVEVTADGFHGEYPWEGTVPFDFYFPIEEGSVMEGEGWTFVLHLNQ